MSDTWDRESVPDATTAASITAPEVDFSAIAILGEHDPQQERRLRANVAIIARRTDDPSLRQLCLSILRGEVSVRRMVEHPSFQGMVMRSAGNLEEGIARLTDEEREMVYARVGANTTSEATEFALMEGRPVPHED